MIYIMLLLWLCFSFFCDSEDQINEFEIIYLCSMQFAKDLDSFFWN